MLVLTRKPGESIVINDNIHVVVVSMDGNKWVITAWEPAHPSASNEPATSRIQRMGVSR